MHDYRELYKGLAENYRLWIYNGQDDGCIPYVGAQARSRDLAVQSIPTTSTGCSLIEHAFHSDLLRWCKSQEWTSHLGFPETAAWHPWFSSDEVDMHIKSEAITLLY